MSLPKIILDIIKVIHDKLEIAPEKDKIIAISLWDFKDENGDTIPKMDLKNGLRKLAEDEKLFQLKDIQCLDKSGRFSGEEIKIEVDRERFEKFYKKHLQEQRAPIGKVEFLDDEAVLKLGDKKCALPPYRSGHYFCRVAFEYLTGEVIDWSVITEKMDMLRQDAKGIERSKRSLYDTVRAINKRVKEVLEIDELFVWEGNTIKRTQ